ncbi:Chitobiosyldiphosphodolichol beta-mannosyltransferase [Podosphaera aphanis]|nr:Chitobiosyldiphosphodolichol beta-mannosyltransferase [Podosphaera aphanis]
MQYHALSIAKHGGRVDLIGYQESSLHPDLINNPRVSIVALTQLPHWLRSKTIPFVVSAPLKVGWQTWDLFVALSYRTQPSRWVLVQNPPSIPTLVVAYLVCLLRKTHLIIDWHNFGWSILAGTKGNTHPFVTISQCYETYLGRWASTANLTVSEAMGRQLRNPPYRIRSPVLTLYDRPFSIFQPIASLQERQAFLFYLPETTTHASDIMAGKTKLLVSSTSWTPDEDFNLLLEALCAYAASPTKTLPHILAIITGKGPEQQYYVNRINTLCAAKKLENISIVTAWLSTEDYANLLACADLGVCLHTSSSGVDLPMKIIDMFGAGLPVVAYSAYESWQELVKEGTNGRGFVSSAELNSILQELLSEKSAKQLSNLRSGALVEGRKRWDDEWDSVAGRLLSFHE